MQIKPLKGVVYLKIETPSVGVLDTSSRPSAIEYAEVLEVGEGVNTKKIVQTSDTAYFKEDILKPGDKVFVKAWAIDIVVYNDVKYHFVNMDSGGILAKVE